VLETSWGSSALHISSGFCIRIISSRECVGQIVRKTCCEAIRLNYNNNVEEMSQRSSGGVVIIKLSQIRAIQLVPLHPTASIPSFSIQSLCIHSLSQLHCITIFAFIRPVRGIATRSRMSFTPAYRYITAEVRSQAQTGQRGLADW
jgi:hypothetical protein